MIFALLNPNIAERNFANVVIRFVVLDQMKLKIECQSVVAELARLGFQSLLMNSLGCSLVVVRGLSEWLEIG